MRAIEGDRGGTISDRLFQFGRIGLFPGTDEHQASAPIAIHAIVGNPVRAVHDDLVWKTIAIGQGVDLERIDSGNASCYRKCHGSRRATGHIPRLCPGHLGDALANGAIQILDGDEMPRGFGHCGKGFRFHPRTAHRGRRAPAVDDGAHPKLLVDRFR